jgi:hypothetical protein
MGKFADDLSKFNRKSSKEMARVKKGVAIKLFNAIVEDTPVLAGTLRGNWRFSIGAPDRRVNELTRDTTGSVSMQIINEVVGSSKGDDAIFMSNSMPYAARIEYDGWSHTKSPFGMVRRNTFRFEILLKETLGESFSMNF